MGCWFKCILCFIMATDRLQLRKRVAQFLELYRSSRDDWRSLTVSHFVAEGRSQSTIYNIIDTYLRRGSVDHKKGAGRPAQKMTPYNKARLRTAVNHKTGVSQRRMAARFNCDQSYISRTVCSPIYYHFWMEKVIISSGLTSQKHTTPEEHWIF